MFFCRTAYFFSIHLGDRFPAPPTCERDYPPPTATSVMPFPCLDASYSQTILCRNFQPHFVRIFSDAYHDRKVRV